MKHKLRIPTINDHALKENPFKFSFEYDLTAHSINRLCHYIIDELVPYTQSLEARIEELEASQDKGNEDWM